MYEQRIFHIYFHIYANYVFTLSSHIFLVLHLFTCTAITL